MTARAPELSRLLVAALVVATASPALADEPTIAIVDFSGRNARKVQTEVVEALREVATIAPRRATRRALASVSDQRKGQIDDFSARAIADELHAEGVLTGVVSRKRRRYRVTLTLHGRNGVPALEMILNLGRRPRVGSHSRRRLTRTLLVSAAELPRRPAPERAAKKRKRPKKSRKSTTGARKRAASTTARKQNATRKRSAKTKRKRTAADNRKSKRTAADNRKSNRTAADNRKDKRTAADNRKSNRTAKNNRKSNRTAKDNRKSKRTAADNRKRTAADDRKSKRTAKADSEAFAIDERAEPATREPDRHEPAPRDVSRSPVIARAPGPAGAHLAVGASMLGRELSFAVREGIEAPYEYRGAPVPAARVEGSVYPAALAGRSDGLIRLGLSFGFERAIGLSSNIDGLDPDIPTTQQRWSVGLHYRLPLGEGERTSISLGARVGERAFTFDRAGLMNSGLALEVPDVRYRAVEPRVAVELPLGDRTVLHASAAALIVQSSGELESEAFYGASSALGLDGDASVSFSVTDRVSLRAGAAYTRVGANFDGSGSQNDRDGDGAPDVGGAIDQYLGAYLMAGVRL